MTYLRNCWYQIAWSDEVAPGGSLPRTAIEEPPVVWRGESGAPSLLADRCPHRMAPLSAGAVSGDRIACGYHGLAFDETGACVHNPHGPVTRALKVRSFPVIERYGAIWGWLGDEAAADPAIIADLSFIDRTPATATIRLVIPTAADYRLVADNIMDLSHADYLHPDTLGGMLTNAEVRTRAEGDTIVTEWTALDCIPPAAYHPQVPAGRADMVIRLTWHPPGLMILAVWVTPPGVAPGDADQRITLHNLTPRDAVSSHYFVCSTRRFAEHDPDVTTTLKAALTRAFLDEDKPMLESQQRAIGTRDVMAMHPALLPIDNGAVRARLVLSSLIAQEAALIEATAAVG